MPSSFFLLAVRTQLEGRSKADTNWDDAASVATSGYQQSEMDSEMDVVEAMIAANAAATAAAAAAAAGGDPNQSSTRGSVRRLFCPALARAWGDAPALMPTTLVCFVCRT